MSCSTAWASLGLEREQGIDLAEDLEAVSRQRSASSAVSCTESGSQVSSGLDRWRVDALDLMVKTWQTLVISRRGLKAVGESTGAHGL
ncbi:MAG TPA: hypothetical protein VGV57_06490 [Thermoleophilaceae bacterium]|nr:hypothetical protein [Thermoleophilaceae bacterium]